MSEDNIQSKEIMHQNEHELSSETQDPGTLLLSPVPSGDHGSKGSLDNNQV